MVDTSPPAPNDDPEDKPIDPAAAYANIPPAAMQTNPQQTLIILTEMGKMGQKLQENISDLNARHAATATRSIRNEEDIGEVKAVAAIHDRDFNNFREVLAATTGKVTGVRGWVNSRAVGIGAGASLGGTIAIYLLYYFGKWMGWL